MTPPIPETIETRAVDSEDEVLEKMLLEAERLAVQMRSASSADFNYDGERSTAEASTRKHGNLSDHEVERKTSETDCGVSSLGKTTLEETPSDNRLEETASLASSQHDGIQAAVEAAKKMEQALKALGSGLSEEQEENREDNDDADADSPPSVDSAPSPAPKSPPNGQAPSPLMLEKKLVSSNSRPNDAADAIKWEKVEPPKEEDEDYVPLADYSKLSGKKGQEFQKVASASQGDNDYTQVSDYSAPNRRQSYVQATRRRARMRRRRMLRSVVGVAIVAALAYFWFANSTGSVPTADDLGALIDTFMGTSSQAIEDTDVPLTDSILEDSHLDDKEQPLDRGDVNGTECSASSLVENDGEEPTCPEESDSCEDETQSEVGSQDDSSEAPPPTDYDSPWHCSIPIVSRFSGGCRSIRIEEMTQDWV